MDLGPGPTTRSTGSSGLQPVNGYVDVWPTATRRSTTATARCSTMRLGPDHDPAQVPSDDVSFIPAAALAAGLEGAFFSTDVDLNNAGSTDLTYELLWLPRAPTTAIRSTASCSRSPQERESATPTCSTRSSDSSRTRSAPWRWRRADGSARHEPDLQPAVGQGGRHLRQELPGIPADKMIPRE